MDKYELVLDIIEHSERYDAESLSKLLSDPEIKKIYNAFCKTESAVVANIQVDVDAEWKRFSRNYFFGKGRLFFLHGSRVASIGVIIFTSILAVGAGIAVSMAIEERRGEEVKDSKIEASENKMVAQTSEQVSEELTYTSESLPIMFEDESLENIIKAIAKAYGVEVKINNMDAASLRLYYKFDPALHLDEVVSQLNTFDQIDIRLNDNTITID